MRNLLARILKPSGKMASWSVLFLLIGLLVLGEMGYLESIKDFLKQEKFSFEITKYRIFLYDVVKAVLLIIIVFWLTAIIADIGETYIKKIKRIRQSSRVLYTKLFQIILYILVAIFTLDAIGIDITSLSILLGALGVGLGFGLQKITSNFISGLILLVEKSIENDDLIAIDNETAGFVKKIGARYTLIETFDKKEVMVPNEDFITNRVTNWTYTDTIGRLEVRVGVSYKSDIKKAHELILEAANEHPRTIKEPSPVCYLTEFGDSSVNFVLYFWINDIVTGRFIPKSEVLFSIWDKFKENNIEIPFPQRDLHIKTPINVNTLQD